jgi:hypothetical protein
VLTVRRSIQVLLKITDRAKEATLSIRPATPDMIRTSNNISPASVRESMC